MKYNNVLELIGNTPIIKIDDDITKLKHIEIWAKCELFNPFGSEDVTIIESSSGNTAKALNVIASIHNVPFENITNRIDIPEARGILKILGGDLIELPGTSSCPDPTDPYDPIVQIEEKVAKNPHYYHTSQYTNLENPKIHHDTTGKEISDDLGKVDYFFGALGTTGSSRGIIEYLQEQNPELKKIGIISKTGGMIPGIRNEEEMMEVRNIPKRII